MWDYGHKTENILDISIHCHLFQFTVKKIIRLEVGEFEAYLATPSFQVPSTHPSRLKEHRPGNVEPRQVIQGRLRQNDPGRD